MPRNENQEHANLVRTTTSKTLRFRSVSSSINFPFSSLYFHLPFHFHFLFFQTPTNLHGILRNTVSCMFEKKNETPITTMSIQNLLSHTLAFAIYMSTATSAACYETSYKYVHKTRARFLHYAALCPHHATLTY